MLDRFARQVDYLRISVTDRCNYRCEYCMPASGMHWLPRAEILSYDEIVRFVREIAVPLGITKLRLTGGEPTVRPGLDGLIRELAAIPQITDVALTTNGHFLETLALPLKAAGLQRLNVSLDSLKPERFAALTRGGDFARVWRGIEAAAEAGLAPLKLNCVVMAGTNEDELVDFVRLSVERGWAVRFIEFMPIGDYARFEQLGYVSSARMRELIRTVYPLESLPAPGTPGNGPARYYRVPGTESRIGFISQMSHDFCESCNRIRLTADGKIRHCLLSDHEIDVRELLRGTVPPEAIQHAIHDDLQQKAERHGVGPGLFDHHRTMSQIGG